MEALLTMIMIQSELVDLFQLQNIKKVMANRKILSKTQQPVKPKINAVEAQARKVEEEARKMQEAKRL